uniref:Spermatosis associated 1 n=1 Tax=Propithecus coquereli TaxID=379532 RepID=A0A2K6GXH7_PROCO
MKKDFKNPKIPTDNYPIQTLANMSLNPSRPSSSELVELHVFYVPEGSWNYELNTISIEVVNKFISAGFIRILFFLQRKMLSRNLKIISEKYLVHVMDPFPNLMNTINKYKAAKNQIGNSEFPGSLEDSNNDYFNNKKSQFLWKNEDDVAISRRQDSQTGEKQYTTLPDLIDFPSYPCQPVFPSGITDIPLLQMEREKIIQQMKQVKEERRYLERIREELIKKVEKLFKQSKLKQYQASDGWKKKYFETKKVTASLEEILTKLREDLELYYKKLLMQLEAREIKMRPKNLENITDSKNYLIIQITEVQHAIDQLKRKLDTDKMKLIIEVKMRKQAVSDLRTLKAELAQKK